MTPIRAVAPAKINLGLEVIGRRPDGYHEVATIFQTVDLCDTVSVSPSGNLTLDVDDPSLRSDDNLVLRTASSFQERFEVTQGAEIRLHKQIPTAAGLGGASSDAAATLRALALLWGIKATSDELHEVALGIGSDVPFLLTGGTAIGLGRGEIVRPTLRQLSASVVLAVPTITIENKTATMFRLLEDEDFTSGSTIVAISNRIVAGESLEGVELPNSFARHAYRSWPELAELAKHFKDAGATAVSLSGAGPTLYSLVAEHDHAIAIRDQLLDRNLSSVRIYLSRTISHIPPPVRDNR